jgi:UDP-N-acetylmuramoyl-L-alanyl-D-glutamate--2,6-diaminopimelate ligase
MQSNLDTASKAAMTVELDRSKAIELALAGLTEHDLLLIAGKGHEAYQDIDGIKHPYSDETTLLSLGYQDVAQPIESLKTDSIKKESIKEVL